MAVPRTPVRSVAIMATSLSSQSRMRPGLGTRAAIAWARSNRETTPSLMARACMNIATTMASHSTASRV
jgi:hypothetical protein